MSLKFHRGHKSWFSLHRVRCRFLRDFSALNTYLLVHRELGCLVIGRILSPLTPPFQPKMSDEKPPVFSESQKWKYQGKKFDFVFTRWDDNDDYLIHGAVRHYNDDAHVDLASEKPASFIWAPTGTFDTINVTSSLNGIQLPVLLLLQMVQPSTNGGEYLATEKLSNSLTGFFKKNSELYCEDGFMKSNCSHMMKSLIMLYHELIYSKKFYARIVASNIYMVKNGSGAVNLRLLDVRKISAGQTFEEKRIVMEAELIELLEQFQPKKESFLRMEYESFILQDFSTSSILSDPFLLSPQKKYDLPMKHYDNLDISQSSYTRLARAFVRGYIGYTNYQYLTSAYWTQKVDADYLLEQVKNGLNANGKPFATYTNGLFDLLRYLRNFVSHSGRYHSLRQLTVRAIVKKFYKYFGPLYILIIHNCSMVNLSKIR